MKLVRHESPCLFVFCLKVIRFTPLDDGLVAGNVTGLTRTGVYNVSTSLWIGTETAPYVEIPGSPFQFHIINDDIDDVASELTVSEEVVVAGNSVKVGGKSISKF